MAAGRVSDSIFAPDYSRYGGDIELFATYQDTGKVGAGAIDRPTTRPADVEDGRLSIGFGPDLPESMSDTLEVLRGKGIEVEFWEQY